MNIQAAVIFFNTEFLVATQTNTREVCLEEIHSYQMDGKWSRNATKCTSLLL